MSKNKKPTMMEVKGAINNLIREIGYIQQAIVHITNSFNAYLDYKDDRDSLTKWLQEKVKEKETTDDKGRAEGNSKPKKASKGTKKGSKVAKINS